MKKIAFILTLMTILMSLSACTKVVDITTETVIVTVEDAEYKEGYTYCYFINGGLTPVNTSDEYKIDVLYGGRK